MEYIELFIGMIFTVAGVLFGFTVVLQIVHASRKRKAKYGQRIYHKENEKAYKELFQEEAILEDAILEEAILDKVAEFESSIYNEEAETEGLLKKRLGKEKESWTQFNCECDQKDIRKHIEAARKKEDGAYCFIKHHKK